MSNGGRKFKPGHSRQQGDAEDRVLDRITKIRSFSEIKPEDYALPGGFANIIAETNKKMKTTQLRKFFLKVKNIESKVKARKKIDAEIKNELYLIIPELAYAVARDRLVTEGFFRIVSIIIKDKIHNVEDFMNFSRFMSAIVAYKKVQEKGVKI